MFNWKARFYICLSVLILLVIYFGAKRIFRVPPQPAPLYIEEKFAILTALPTDSNDILLIGNSLTERFPEELLRPGVKKRGVSNSTTYSILENISSILKGRPTKVFLEIGFNDLYKGTSEDSVCINIIEIVNRIHIISPRTKVFIQSLVPACGKYRYVDEYVIRANKKLKEYCEHSGITFIDLHSKLGPQYTFDGVHLKLEGYKIWLEMIEPYLK